jgi:putative Ca2+/H+ antiporter (TMEM165/GDT1 family)
MSLSLVLSSFALLFVAEMGDKTQLMTMTLAHRYRAGPVIAGVFAAFVLLNLLAVSVGEALFRYIPQRLVLFVAGALFLTFAWRSWCDSRDGDDDEVVDANGRNAFFASFTLLFVAELGDKTQLAMVAMAAGTGDLVSVFVGGTLALWAVSLIGVALGGTLLRRVPRYWMHRAAAGLFFVFGAIAIARALLMSAA